MNKNIPADIPHLNELKKKKNVVAAYMFGSHGTPRQNPLSDVDICVFTKDTNKKTVLDIYSYGSDKIDISVFDNLPLYIKPEVFKGKPLFIKDKFFIAERFAKSFREYQDFKKYQDVYWKNLKKRIKK